MVTWAGGGGGCCLRALCFPLSAPVADRTGQNAKLCQGIIPVNGPPNEFFNWLNISRKYKTHYYWIDELSISWPKNYPTTIGWKRAYLSIVTAHSDEQNRRARQTTVTFFSGTWLGRLLMLGCGHAISQTNFNKTVCSCQLKVNLHAD